MICKTCARRFNAVDEITGHVVSSEDVELTIHCSNCGGHNIYRLYLSNDELIHHIKGKLPTE